MKKDKTKHITVFKEEVIQLLEVKSDGVYVDATLGGGGHSLEIANNLSDEGLLISLEIDENSIPQVPSSLEKKWKIENENFSALNDVLKKYSVQEIDGLIADLGWSTDQLETIAGLSHSREEEELDMRFHQSLGVTAADLLNALGKNELKKMWSKYADLYGSSLNRLVETLIRERKKNKIIHVGDLNEIIEIAFRRETDIISIFSKIYQALRIAVNGEFEALKQLLDQVMRVLKKGGHVLIITFHSGEDKIVESFIKRHLEKLEILTESNKNKWYLQPSIDELKANLQSRSAKLWGFKTF